MKININSRRFLKRYKTKPYLEIEESLNGKKPLLGSCSESGWNRTLILPYGKLVFCDDGWSVSYTN